MDHHSRTAGRKKLPTEHQHSGKARDSKNSPYGQLLPSEPEKAGTLAFRLIQISDAVRDLVECQNKNNECLMAVIAPRGKHKQKVHSRGSHSRKGGQDPEPPVILIAVLMLHIRDMKRTDTEVCDDEHLLTEGGKPESENPAVLRAGKMHGKKREYDSRQRIYCAADRIPQIVFFKWRL